jgi:hypothetical protein
VLLKLHVLALVAEDRVGVGHDAHDGHVEDRLVAGDVVVGDDSDEMEALLGRVVVDVIDPADRAAPRALRLFVVVWVAVLVYRAEKVRKALRVKRGDKAKKLSTAASMTWAGASSIASAFAANVSSR